QGERVTVLSAQAIRAVALGIVVTALIQALVGGIGLLLTGVPYPLLLMSVMFLFGVAQIGAVPVLLGAVVWVYWTSGTFWAVVLFVWTVIAGGRGGSGHRPAAASHPAGRRRAATAHLRGRHRRPPGVRPDRAVRGAGRALGDLHAAGELGGPGTPAARAADVGGSRCAGRRFV